MPQRRVMFIGDVVGEPGRTALTATLPSLVDRYEPTFVICNGENVAGGLGITKRTAEKLLDAGVDVITTGNHVYRHRDVYPFLDATDRVVRPANYLDSNPGRGHTVVEKDGVRWGVINLSGNVFMHAAYSAFHIVDRLVSKLQDEADVVVVDIHAETTSEKIAMGWHLDGRVTAVLGTHTHVQTADDRVLPGGTAYLTDAGMTGPHDSIIGMEKEPSLARFLNAMPAKFEPASGNPRLNGAVIEADDKTGRATKITRISYSAQELDELAVRPAVRRTHA